MFSLILKIVESASPEERVCRSAPLAEATASMARACETLSSQFSDWLELARDVHRQTVHRYSLERPAPVNSQYLQVRTGVSTHASARAC